MTLPSYTKHQAAEMEQALILGLRDIRGKGRLPNIANTNNDRAKDAHSRRQSIVALLSRTGPLPSREIGKRMGITTEMAANDIAALRVDGDVHSEKDGRFYFHGLTDDAWVRLGILKPKRVVA